MSMLDEIYCASSTQSNIQYCVKICLMKYFNYLYRDFLKQQKTMSTELARMSSKGSNEVAGDITLCQKNLQFIEHNLDKQKTSVEKLKYETNKVHKLFRLY